MPAFFMFAEADSRVLYLGSLFIYGMLLGCSDDQIFAYVDGIIVTAMTMGKMHVSPRCEELMTYLWKRKILRIARFGVHMF